MEEVVMLRNLFAIFLIWFWVTISPLCCIAQEKKGGGDLRAAAQNPVGAMYSLPLKFSFDYGAPNGEASFLNIQPVIPITVGDWNLINRVIAPLIDTPGQVTGTPEIPNPPPGDGATGLGDINYSVFLSPAKPKGAIWGIGPSIMFPSATDKQLGSEKMERRAHRRRSFSTEMGNHRRSCPAALVLCRQR